MNKPLLTLLLLLAWISAHAGIYRWVDENGVTVYSQTPPLKKFADKLKPPPGPAEDPDEVNRRIDQQRQEVEDYLEDKELAAEKRRQAKQEQEVNAKNCHIARNNLSNLEIAVNRLVKKPDGSYERLTEQQRQEKISQAKEDIKKYCQ